MLEDGTYDVVVVDAESIDTAVRVEATVLAGTHKGEILAINVVGLGRDPLDLLAVPGTVVVTNGQPHLTLEG